ncbi:hypothetical protein EVAR_101731_1 [Eumeta japonica]|uniref:Uncharacterized protein n=1 Tax=Eumeta variegata TaxID=151549 RepID=A0A4C1TCU2_EUMVA|nr:hypothetical protein EVAR_101731_1 [Eumeta japonica]
MYSKPPPSSSSLMKKSSGRTQGASSAVVPVSGPPITTNIDERNALYQHQVKHEKTIEAVITEYPGVAPVSAVPQQSLSYDRSLVLRNSFRNDNARASDVALVSGSVDGQQHELHESYQQVTRNKRISTEVLGSGR